MSTETSTDSLKTDSAQSPFKQTQVRWISGYFYWLYSFALQLAWQPYVCSIPMMQLNGPIPGDSILPALFDIQWVSAVTWYQKISLRNNCLVECCINIAPSWLALRNNVVGRSTVALVRVEFPGFQNVVNIVSDLVDKDGGSRTFWLQFSQNSFTGIQFIVLEKISRTLCSGSHGIHRTTLQPAI